MSVMRSKVTAIALTLATCAAAAGLVFACGTSSDGDTPAPDAAADAQAFAYRGAGCGYDVTIPERNGYVDVALDDPASAGSAPVRVRIGLGGNTKAGSPGYADPSRTAVFTWETADKVTASKIRLGASPDALSDTRAGYSWTTPRPEGFGSNEPETYMHEVHVCGLEPGRTYYYQVGGGAPEVWSDTQSFTSVPADGTIKVGILGDSRAEVEVWQLAERRMRDLAVNVQLTTGDLVFVGSQQSLYDKWLGAIWKDPAEPGRFITLGQQMMVMIAGNHENDAARFYGAFAIPGEGPWAEMYASFDIGNTHFAMIDDQPIAQAPDGEAAKEILAWLEQDLAKADANRDKTPFLAVLHHRGIYSTSNHATDEDVLATRRVLAPMYAAHHVDVAFNGHDHAFERSKPLVPGADPGGDPVVVAEGKGTVYVINAGVGAPPYSVDGGPHVEVSARFGADTTRVGFYGVLTLEGRKLTFTSYGLTTAGADPVIDELVLTK